MCDVRILYYLVIGQNVCRKLAIIDYIYCINILGYICPSLHFAPFALVFNEIEWEWANSIKSKYIFFNLLTQLCKK